MANETPVEAPRRSNIQDVARLAGVSRATAARVFADSPNVAPATRTKVLEAAKLVNYTPNPMARGLKGGPTNSVGVLWSLGGNVYAAEITRQIAQSLHQRGYMAHVVDFGGDPALDREILQEYARRGMDGLVLQTDTMRWLIGDPANHELLRPFKAVVLVTPKKEDLPYDQVVRDRNGAYREAAAHFAESGRKKPAILISYVNMNQPKADAYLDELRLRGIQLYPEPIIDISQQGSFSLKQTAQLLKSQFENETFPFDAVMCSNDATALVMRDWLCRNGLRTPEHVALIGFNDSEIAPYMDPPLASVDRRSSEVAHAIMELLLARLNQPDRQQQIQHIPMKFVWRESAGS
jgi:LacI family transcriptional regulator